MTILQWNDFVSNNNNSFKCDICKNIIFQILPHVSISESPEKKVNIIQHIKCTKCNTVYSIIE